MDLLVARTSSSTQFLDTTKGLERRYGITKYDDLVGLIVVLKRIVAEIKRNKRKK